MSLPTLGIIFAAGRGSRLAPLTDSLPKPLLEIGGKTLLEWNMANTSMLVDRFIIVLHHLGDQIVDFLGDEYGGKPITYAWQKSPRGTLDAFRTAIFLPAIAPIAANYLVTNADEIHGQETFLKIQHHITNYSDQAAIVAQTITDHSRLSNFGVIQVEGANFLKIVEKPTHFISELVNIGLYYFPAQVRQFVRAEQNPDLQEEFITEHLLNPYHQQYPIQVIRTTDTWLPVNNYEELAQARCQFPQ